ncbi:MAG: sodium:solute symporter family protein [Candidatus Megaira endosymbiont of Carteria cerasiformis]|nr:sodium:solute symporter family protein [Candidatus Megaera polyxenophila]MCC8461074.1 sodium:solute symporter family protein [Candidatus Megaera polyxenophila]
MVWNVDHIIFFAFLILNIILGLKSSKGITSITQYAIGDRNFSTGAIVATIVSTWIGGGFFFLLSLQKLTLTAFLLFLGYFFIPRMGQFLGKLSIAEAMGELYGNKVRLITAISGIIGVCGIIAIQFKVAGLVFEYLLNISKFQGIFLIGAVVILYSTMGGIKSVTFTDMIQFLTFGSIIPIMTYYFFNNLPDSYNSVVNALSNQPKYNLGNIFDTSKVSFWNNLSLFFICLIPGFNSAVFQRISMAKNVDQAKRSFVISAQVCFVIFLIVIWLVLVIEAKTPNISADDIIKVLIFDQLIPVYKGLMLVGVIAMTMSTADSYINSSSILFSHDFLRSLNIKVKNELLAARITSLIIGTIALLLSLKDTTVFKLWLYLVTAHLTRKLYYTEWGQG